MHGTDKVPSAKLPLFKLILLSASSKPNNWHSNIICISICTQNNYHEDFRMLFQMKIKRPYTNNNYPTSDCHKAYNTTEVTASSSTLNAIYSISTVNWTGDFVCRYSKLWAVELTVAVSRSHTVGSTPLYSDQSVTQAATFCVSLQQTVGCAADCCSF